MRTILTLTLLSALFCFSGCDDAEVVSANISKAADNFEVTRRVVFYNGITGEYILSLEGRCSITYDRTDKQLEVTCKVGEDQYKKHFLGLSDNVTYFAEQIDGIQASPYHYRVTFKPQVVLPSVNVR